MVAPILVAIPAAAWWVVGTLVIGGVTSYAIFKNWHKLKKQLKGKKITILGQRATGKTTLLNFLINGEITVVYEQTLMKKKVRKQKKFALSDLGLDSSKATPYIDADSYDVGGSEDQHGAWKELATGADVLIYLFDINKWLSNPKLEPIIERDISVIEGIIRDKTNKQIMLIGTHLDQDEGYKAAKDKIAYKDEIKGETFIIGMRTLLGGSDRCTVELASLKDQQGLSEVTTFILANGFRVDQS